ncbi:hypothetical protein [Nostoc sp.]|uniref:hypothetical protein n=1 Tax=Nostoc sp. TaxID=1180 RepID=UPI002FF9C216
MVISYTQQSPQPRVGVALLLSKLCDRGLVGEAQGREEATRSPKADAQTSLGAGLIKTLKPAIAGFACIATYFLKRLVKIKIVESPLVKLEFAQ